MNKYSKANQAVKVFGKVKQVIDGMERTWACCSNVRQQPQQQYLQPPPAAHQGPQYGQPPGPQQQPALVYQGLDQNGQPIWAPQQHQQAGLQPQVQQPSEEEKGKKSKKQKDPNACGHQNPTSTTICAKCAHQRCDNCDKHTKLPDFKALAKILKK